MPSDRSPPRSPACPVSPALSPISTRPTRPFSAAQASSSSSSDSTVVARRAMRRSYGCVSRSSPPWPHCARRIRAPPLTLLLLFLAFGAVAAAAIPLGIGGLAIGLALGGAALAARAWPLSIALQNVVSMLGLGLGVDYTLLLVTRFREARAAGSDPEAAATEAARHAGHSVLV